jgi:hypothetical protein
MPTTLRDLLIQRAARLQARPALTAPGWGTLSHAQFRNRVEGVALGLLATPAAPAVFSATGTAWDWAAEVAAATSGIAWDPTGQRVPDQVLGGARFNDEAGREPYHQREQVVQAATPFCADLDQGELLLRLRRLNGRLEWDHETCASLPAHRLGEPMLRAALWSALFAGAHAVLDAQDTWDETPFLGFWRS